MNNYTADFDIVDQRDKNQEVIIANFMSLGSLMLTVILDVVNMINDGKDDLTSIVFFEGMLQKVGAFILKLSDELIFIYKGGDPEVDAILKAPLRKLSEFLTSENNTIRLLAAHRLGELNKRHEVN